MKKFLSILLALVMILSLATVAFADEEETEVATYSKDFTLKKVWNVNGAKDGVDVYPDQDVHYAAADVDGAPTVTFETLNAAEVTPETDEDGNKYFEIQGKVEGVTDVGEWHYTVNEVALNAQGAATASDGSIELVVFATYNANGGIDITVGGELVNNKKDDTFTNVYNLGTLSVKKEVSGSAGKKDVAFDIDVTLTAGQPVASEITISDGQTIAISDWTSDGQNGYTATKTVSLKHDQTVYFYNVPAGVTYVVEEQSKHLVGEDGIVDINNPTSDYTVTYTDNEGSIVTATTAEAVVKNVKNANTDTGIVLDSMPYILLLAVAAAGLFVLLNKKRVNEF